VIITISNNSGKNSQGNFTATIRNLPPQEKKSSYAFTGISLLLSNDLEQIDPKKLEKKGVLSGPIDWMAYEDGYFMTALTAMVGFWATLSLNIPDFSRYARSQRSQVIGQIIGLPLTMFLFAGLGVLLTAASRALIGETIADPINLIGHIDSPFWVVVSMLIIILATISTNTAANIVSPTNVFQNIAPKHIDETKGVLLTGLIGIVLMSWELLKQLGWLDTDVSVEGMYSNWLIGYSSLLGPIAGIMVVDYFAIKKQSYDLLALYKDNAGYPAWNRAGFTAFLVPVGLTVVAITTGKLSWFYTYGWFTGSILGGLIYWIAAREQTRS
jgi:NCS1 family nucleobase:cation symporter-1